ncbi:MAG: hypothetical protein KJ915_12315 [Candidatus Omnitrophica bacterium]|nr:hypothetical protein [Candidatus Omnitrophota bacterium]
MFKKSLIIMMVFALSSTAFAKSESEFVYKDKETRDPFISLVTIDGRILPGAREITESTNIELGGVIWDPTGKSLAIINGKPVKEQQRIMNFQVLKIKKDSVLLQKEGKVIVLYLKKGGGDKNGE